MRILSRHLPPAPQINPISTAKLVAIIGICSVITAIALCFAPIRGAMVSFIVSASIFAGIAVILTKIGDKKIEVLMSGRKGEDICTFRHAFDLRRIDPWIVRAAYEEIQNWFGVKYPIRASDRLTEDLQIDPDDIGDIANTIAIRAGYDLQGIEQNPLKDKVQTVSDLVAFFTYQRRIRP